MLEMTRSGSRSQSTVMSLGGFKRHFREAMSWGIPEAPNCWQQFRHAGAEEWRVLEELDLEISDRRWIESGALR